MKELRVHRGNAIFRIAFCFDTKRECWLLLGADKKGKKEDDFYRDLIKRAEELIAENHLFD